MLKHGMWKPRQLTCRMCFSSFNSGQPPFLTICKECADEVTKAVVRQM